MKIKYCVKPQTVLTVQKENAFFAASMSTSVSVGHVAALVCSGFPVSLSPHPNQASLSRCANQRATEPETATGQHHNLWLEVLLEVRAWWPCPERPRPCAGGGHHGPCWCISREPQRASQSQEHQYNFPKKGVFLGKPSSQGNESQVSAQEYLWTTHYWPLPRRAFFSSIENWISLASEENTGLMLKLSPSCLSFLCRVKK